MTTAAASPADATGVPRPCNRCKEQEGTIELRVAERVCKTCFAYYVSSKAIKRLEALQRETSAPRSSGSGPRGQRRPQRYLVGLSCGPSSTALLHVLTENARQQRAKGQKTARFEYVAVHVVDDTLSPSPPPPRPGLGGGGGGGTAASATEPDGAEEEEEEPSYLAAYRARFPDAGLVPVPLSSALALRSVDWTALPSPSPTTTTSSPSPESSSPARRRQQQLCSVLAQLPSTTSRADVRRLLTRHILIATAARRRCDALLLGHSTTSLAELTLSETAKGRGFSLPHLVNDGPVPVPPSLLNPDPSDSDIAPNARTNDDKSHSSPLPTPTTLPVYSPLRELFRNELLTYLAHTTPALTALLPPSSSTTTSSSASSATSGGVGGAVVSHRDLSIDDVLSRYFGAVEASYPSVVANVVRTTGKLSRGGGGDGDGSSSSSEDTACGLCGAGLDEQGDERWRGEIGSAGADETSGTGRPKPKLCYGCERSVCG